MKCNILLIRQCDTSANRWYNTIFEHPELECISPFNIICTIVHYAVCRMTAQTKNPTTVCQYNKVLLFRTEVPIKFPGISPCKIRNQVAETPKEICLNILLWSKVRLIWNLTVRIWFLINWCGALWKQSCTSVKQKTWLCIHEKCPKL